MDNDKTRDLELRIKKLEDELASVRSSSQAVDLTPEDIQAFIKVRDTITHKLGSCLPCIPCINECVCGPCNICGMGGGGFGGGGRFGGLGG